MVSTVWDNEVETTVDRRPGGPRAARPSEISLGYLRELDHRSPFAEPLISGELALAPTLPDVLASVPPPPPASVPGRPRTTRRYRGPLPGELAPVIPMPGATARPVPTSARPPAHLPPSRGKLPLLAVNQRPRPGQHPQVRCLSHGHLADQLCISCDTPLCPKCQHLLINDRPWCMRCGKKYRPTLLSALVLTAKVVARVSLLLVTVFATVFYAPVPLAGRAAAALVLGLILAWFLFLNDRHEVDVKVVAPPRHKRAARGTR